jgi:hypothetical protein
VGTSRTCQPAHTPVPMSTGSRGLTGPQQRGNLHAVLRLLGRDSADPATVNARLDLLLKEESLPMQVFHSLAATHDDPEAARRTWRWSRCGEPRSTSTVALPVYGSPARPACALTRASRTCFARSAWRTTSAPAAVGDISASRWAQAISSAGEPWPGRTHELLPMAHGPARRLQDEEDRIRQHRHRPVTSTVGSRPGGTICVKG